MNEAETRAELIDPKLKANGWGVIEGSKILRERNVCKITDGRIQLGGGRKKPLIADYILVYKGVKLAVVEAKSNELKVGEGVAQAKLYAEKLQLHYTYSTNGKEIYQICMRTGEEKLVDNFLSPTELWNEVLPFDRLRTSPKGTPDELVELWFEKFMAIPFEDKSGTWQPRYYQEIAVKNTLEAVAQNKKRILLTLATGTGKTAIAFQIAWKLYHTRWTARQVHRPDEPARRPRILFLADRNILADQAFNSFSAFPDDAMVRIRPKEIKKRGKAPTNGSIFFTIFQTFASGFTSNSGENYTPNIKNELPMVAEPHTKCGADNSPVSTLNFQLFPEDFFDFIIIDECHRGGANDESNWRNILEYFAPAVQLGLTATPKRKDNADTYRYFGEPVYIYSLKDGINDGFLTPFKVKRINTTLDDYIYTSDDTIIEGEAEEGKLYTEADFNRIIEIKEREAKRVRIFMNKINQNEKTIVFCATQDHAAAVRDLINQHRFKSLNDQNLQSKTKYNTLAKPIEPYCVRVTANDGEIGEQFLREFQDNEKTMPTILTTSQKLSTGVDARNIRNIILMRPVNQIIEFKQIVGRGTRLFDGKAFFTIYDFVNAYQRFSDPEWDGEQHPEELTEGIDGEPKEIDDSNKFEDNPEKEEVTRERKKKLKVKLKDGKVREIQYMIGTSFWSAEGKAISAQEFLENLFGKLPNFFKCEEELRKIWSSPLTRKTLLESLDEAGFGKEELKTLQRLINAEKSDLFDVLEYVFDSDFKPITREERATRAKATIFALLNDKQKEFIEFVLKKYVEAGVSELDRDKLPILLQTKYQSLKDAVEILGDTQNISSLFIEFQKHLYDTKVA